MTFRIGRTSALLTAALTAAMVTLLPGTASATVSSLPAATPQLGTSGTDGSVEQVRQIVQCGSTMYAVGTFTQVKNAGSTALIARNNAFAFSAVAPYRVTGWNPNVNGMVDTAECAGDGSILLGGRFTSAGGNTAVRNIARVDGTSGAALPFGLKAGGRVAHIEVLAGHALVGGYFAGYLTSVNPITGASDGYRMPSISGSYNDYPGVASNSTRIWNMTPSPKGDAVLMTGVFDNVGGQHHEQIFRLNLTAGSATVSAWAPTELESHCATVEPFYAQDAAWSPDGSMIYTATTGYKPYDQPSSAPRTGPCDAVIAYSASEVRFNGHRWINYTGCDSFFSVAADATTVFAGGHQRWVSNPNGCDWGGPGSVAQPGLAEFYPTDGSYQPGPSRGRGLGADDLLRTSAGLWVASDNQANTSTCAGKPNHMGICFLPNG